jgi:DNA-directed RNA polymerase subunit RPC12/RpoP
MSRKLLQCEDCEASFELKHDMDDNYYRVTYCPFCSSKLELEDDLEDEEDEW